jgi:hypothetical protein
VARRDAKVLKNMVPPTRIERATRGLGNRCSIQLSYGGVLYFHQPGVMLASVVENDLGALGATIRSTASVIRFGPKAQIFEPSLIMYFGFGCMNWSMGGRNPAGQWLSRREPVGNKPLLEWTLQDLNRNF